MYNNHDVVLSVYLETDQPVYLVTGVVKQFIRPRLYMVMMYYDIAERLAK